MKRILVLLLTVCLVIGMLPSSVLAAEAYAKGKCGLNVTWELDSEGLLLIYGSGEIDHTQSVTVPAWKNYLGLIKKVEIQEGVTAIGESSFAGCSALEQVILPNSLTTIGDHAFYRCWNLTELILPAKLESIGVGAFFGTGFSTLTVPEKITTIPKTLFENCSKLTSVTFLGPITDIGERAFYNCEALETVGFEKAVSGEINKEAFAYCKKLNKIEISEGVDYIEDRAFVGCKNLTSVTLPESLISLGGDAFSQTGLTSITIPKNVVYIGNRPFSSCYGLENITVYSESVEGLRGSLTGEEALEYIHIIGDAPKSEEARINSRNENFVIYYDAGTSGWVPPSWKGWLIRIWDQPDAPITGTCGENLAWVLKDGVLTISGTGSMDNYDAPHSAASWYLCRNMITQVVIEEGVESIGNSAFYDLPNLTSFSIAGSVKSIGSRAFQKCTQLKDVYIPSSVVSMGTHVFNECTGLTNVTIADSVTEIGWYSFGECTNLTTVKLSENLTQISSSLFSGCEKLEKVNIPLNCTAIAPHAFKACSSLTTISIADGVTTIGEGAFAGSGLVEVTIPDSITALARSVFSGCQSLKYIYFLGDAPEIGDYAFQNVVATCIYPAGNDTWTEEVKQNYGGTITWNTNSHEHTYEAYSVNSTCTEKGYRGQRCASCGYIYVEEYIDLLEHAYEAISIEPTCTEKGYYGQKCADCGYTSIEGYQDPLGHDMAPATCMMRSTCRRENCGHWTGSTTGHVWEDPCLTTRTCSVCGVIDSNGGHDWDTSQSGARYCRTCEKIEGGYLFDISEIPGEVWIDGEKAAPSSSPGFCYVLLNHPNAKTMVTYTYANAINRDRHMQYPTGMKVWLLTVEGDRYKATYVAEFENLLQYSGSSIRISGTKGIRMITGIEKSKKQALTGSGLAGYKLVEYGTALCWDKDLKDNKPLTLGESYVKSNYAYKRGVADPVFAQTDTLIQYTNVLVGFNLDQCIDDIAMRPYIILEDAEGQQITIYGGIVYRSIGYIAYQNRNVFQAGTSSYYYVWEIIRHVYGIKYDPEFKG